MHLQTEFRVQVRSALNPEMKVSLNLRNYQNRDQFIAAVRFILAEKVGLIDIRVEWLTPIPSWLQDYDDVGEYVFEWIHLNRWERREILAYLAIFGEERLYELEDWDSLMEDIKERGEGRHTSPADFARSLIERQQSPMFMQEWEEFIDYDKFFEDRLSGSYEGFDGYYFYIN